ncbi:MAG: FtsX-like permease family protein [Bacteroidetes bacterium]|nr:FtsX-like permease family protein [Bacteroidota bacterium]
MINVPYYIAKRYLSTRKKKNAIHWITRVSVIGIAVTTAALIILLSAFNGIETMVKKLYSDFDPDITIRSSSSKTLFENQIDTFMFQSNPKIKSFHPALEEVVVLKHEKKWVNANLVGVPNQFLKNAKVASHMVDGFPVLQENGEPLALIGASLLDKLEGYIPSTGYETILLYAPKRDMKMKLGKNPFNTQNIKLSGRINYNREVNIESIVVPLQLAKELYGFENEVSAWYIKLKDAEEMSSLQQELQEKLGPDFRVRTSYQKNELIYQTSKTERRIVILILLFIFIIAAFTLVAALTMLYIEKKDNMKTLESIGADDRFMFRLFFYEGILIAGKGIFFGFALGYIVCGIQLWFKLLQMPNSNGEPFPITLAWSDGLLILSLVGSLAFLASYLPAKFLVRKK